MENIDLAKIINRIEKLEKAVFGGKNKRPSRLKTDGTKTDF